FPVVRQRRELLRQRGAGRIREYIPQRVQRLRSGERAGLTFEVLFSASSEQRKKEVVHRAEVVVNELRLEDGLLSALARGDGGVTLLEHQLERRVGQRGPR